MITQSSEFDPVDADLRRELENQEAAERLERAIDAVADPLRAELAHIHAHHKTCIANHIERENALRKECKRLNEALDRAVENLSEGA